MFENSTPKDGCIQIQTNKLKDMPTCKQGRSCDKRGKSAACNNSVLPYQASSTTLQCRSNDDISIIHLSTMEEGLSEVPAGGHVDARCRAALAPRTRGRVSQQSRHLYFLFSALLAIQVFDNLCTSNYLST